MSATATRIHVGRVVYYFGGYGNIDGRGAIVAVHGTPNQEPARTISNGVGRVIRQADCMVDVILFDGRRINGLHQAGIDAIGIGIKLEDEVLDSVEHLPEAAAWREAGELIEKIKARVKFEAEEAGRVIEDAPVFFWNGIKDQRGAKLQKCHYSLGGFVDAQDKTITIYAREYIRFSSKVRDCFTVKNDSDSMTDYFESDKIRVIPSHPLYAQVKAAHDAQRKHYSK